FYLVPRRGFDRHDDVQPFAAGRFDEALQFERRKTLAHVTGRRNDILPACARPGVEIEYHSVRPLAVVIRRAAHVDLKHAGLCQRNKAVEIVDRNDLVAFLGDKIEVPGVNAVRVLLEKALSFRAVRTAQQRDRPAGDVRLYPFPDGDIKLGQFLFGNADILPVNTVGMAERDTGDRYSVLVLALRRALARLGRSLAGDSPAC